MSLDERRIKWQPTKNAATDCIMWHGGTLTHHRGVGCERAPWHAQKDGALGVEALRPIKRALDPQTIMNPAKLI